MFVAAAFFAAMLYKVDFDVHDGIEGKDHPSMHYSMLVDESRKGVFQAASRVPFEQCTPPYFDAGVSIELKVHDSEGKIRLEGAIEISSISGVVCLGSLCVPIITQRNVALDTTVELEKPTLVLDDQSTSAPSAPHKIEIVVTRVN